MSHSHSVSPNRPYHSPLRHSISSERRYKSSTRRLFLCTVDIHLGIIGCLGDEGCLQPQGVDLLRIDVENLLLKDDLHYHCVIGLLLHIIDLPFKIAGDHLLLDATGTHLLSVTETHLHLIVTGDHLFLDTKGDHLLQYAARDCLYQRIGVLLLGHIIGDHLPLVAEYHLLLHSIEDRLLQCVTCHLLDISPFLLSNIDPCHQGNHLQMLLLNVKEDHLGVMVLIHNHLK